MPALVQVRALLKDYHMGDVTVNVLRGLDLDFDEGDFVALMGPSGSGKSTLMNILGCLDRPSGGRYILRDADVSQMSDDQLSEVRSSYLGFIFQAYNLLPQYTVVENIEIPLLYQGVKLDASTKARCAALAEMVGLGDRLDHRPLQLSGGQQQRVAIARSLVNDPRLILADEPTGNLDRATGQAVMDLLFDLREKHGTTLVLITHDPALAEKCDRQLRMEDGKLVQDTALVPAE